MVNRLRLTLEQDEYSALLKIAVAELRNPEDQARFIIRRELERAGLLPASVTAQAQPAHVAEVNHV